MTTVSSVAVVFDIKPACWCSHKLMGLVSAEKSGLPVLSCLTCSTISSHVSLTGSCFLEMVNVF